MADKRYQVFVSSTYLDLKEERLAVQRALLSIDCIPAGMELFPADDAGVWEVIKRVIDDCDYYVLIVAGRYGSLDDAGVSYTQKEYEYAHSLGMPVAPFFHDTPDDIKVGKSEKQDELRAKLEAFKVLVASRHTLKGWSDPGRLEAAVVVGVQSLIRTKPAIGWVRSSDVVSIEEVADLRGRVIAQEKQIERLSHELGPEIEDLASGTDTYELTVRLRYRSEGSLSVGEGRVTRARTWDELFGAIGPLMLGEATEAKLKSALGHSLVKVNDTITLISAAVEDDHFEAIKLQLIVLGLIKVSDRNHGVKDTQTYLTLTRAGHSHLLRIRAIKKPLLAIGSPRESAATAPEPGPAVLGSAPAPTATSTSAASADAPPPRRKRGATADD